MTEWPKHNKNLQSLSSQICIVAMSFELPGLGLVFTSQKWRHIEHLLLMLVCVLINGDFEVDAYARKSKLGHSQLLKLRFSATPQS